MQKRAFSSTAERIPSLLSHSLKTPSFLFPKTNLISDGTVPLQEHAAVLFMCSEKLPSQLDTWGIPESALEGLKGDKANTRLVYCGTKDAPKKVVLAKSSGKTHDLRIATHQALELLRGEEHALLLPSAHTSQQEILEIARAGILSRHRFDKYKKDSKNGPQVHLQVNERMLEHVQNSMSKVEAFALGTIIARELCNERAHIVHPQFMEECASDLVKSSPRLSLKVLAGKQLSDRNLHLLNAVGQGAEHYPRLLSITYTPKNGSTENPIALVGKGITFDTGGLNLKPTGFMEDMHLDMGGSAAVLGAMKTISMLEPDKSVVAVLAVAENSIDSLSYKPHQIIGTKRGSVEVSNTDAEGRLALADAFTYVQEDFDPKIVVDIATLTGACVVALGESSAGLFSNNDELAGELMRIGDSSWERCWRLPILPEHRDDLKGTYSDLRSTGKSKYGGACTAAAFLETFIDPERHWAHIDMAGPGCYSAQRDFMPLGGTGFGSHLLSQFVLEHK